MNNIMNRAMARCMAFIMLFSVLIPFQAAASESICYEGQSGEYEISVPESSGSYVVMTEREVSRDSETVVEGNDLTVYVADSRQEAVRKGDIVEENIEFEGSLGRPVHKAIVNKKAKGSPKSTNDRNDKDTDWNVDMINADEVQRSDRTHDAYAEPVRIAVLDSGVDYIMSDANVTKAVNLVETEQDMENMLNDMTGHGTSAAGIISSIDPDAEIYSVRVLDENNKGTLSRIVAGIYWCIDHDVDIINMSFGTYSDSRILQEAVKDAAEKGILLISAAGNDQDKEVQYPAKYNEVTAVGAVDGRGVISDNNAGGSGTEIYAPGENVTAQSMLGMYTEVSGTSAAAPHASAAAGILWERDRKKSAGFIRKLLAASSNRTTVGDDAEAGIIDLEYAEEIYDQFNAETADEIQKNDNTVDTASDDEVAASWGTMKDGSNGHEKLVTLGKKDADVSLTNEEIRAIKRGAVYPDKADLDHNCFHGRRCSNWMAPYKYITVIAKRLGKTYGSLTYPTEREVFPKGSFSSQISTIRKTIQYNRVYYDKNGADKYLDWSHTKILGDCNYADYKSQGNAAKMAKLKSLFVYGLALHELTDTYAHSAFVKRDGTYKKIVHENDVLTAAQKKSVGPHIIGADDSTVVKERWADARNAASNLIAKAVKCESGVIKDFAPSVTDKARGYYLHRPIEKAYQIDPSDTYKKAFKYIDYASFK